MKPKRLQEGDRLPPVTLKTRVRVIGAESGKDFVWKQITTEDLFKGKRIALFSIPGAFTPVCSCDHLPSYESRYDDILKMGVDDVYCISMNDAFVMRQWGITQGLREELQDNSHPMNPGNFQRVKLIPDGTGTFTRAVGMSFTFENACGLGERSWRYSAVINDMVVEKIFMEEDGNMADNDTITTLEVSDGQTMLHYLEETAQKFSKTHL